MAIEGARPPFNYTDANGDLQGFEIDLGKALCTTMKALCTFQAQDWDGMIPSLLENRFDAILSSMDITPERKTKIAFSKRYYFIPPVLLAHKDSAITAATPEALEGKTVGAVMDSPYAALLEERYGKTELKTYDTVDSAALDLLLGRIDAVASDRLSFERFLKSREGACCTIKAVMPYMPAYHGEGVGIGLRKSDMMLKQKFDQAIDAVIADGTYDRIRARYLDFDIK